MRRSRSQAVPAVTIERAFAATFHLPEALSLPWCLLVRAELLEVLRHEIVLPGESGSLSCCKYWRPRRDSNSRPQD
jgi:hypothetical protein